MNIGVLSRRRRKQAGNKKASKADSIFSTVDTDGDGYLNEAELLRVVEKLGIFTGSVDEWPSQYQKLRSDFGFPAAGMDSDTFRKGFEVDVA